jgi:hypothetical protein
MATRTVVQNNLTVNLNGTATAGTAHVLGSNTSSGYFQINVTGLPAGFFNAGTFAYDMSVLDSGGNAIPAPHRLDLAKKVEVKGMTNAGRLVVKTPLDIMPGGTSVAWWFIGATATPETNPNTTCTVGVVAVEF